MKRGSGRPDRRPPRRDKREASPPQGSRVTTNEAGSIGAGRIDSKISGAERDVAGDCGTGTNRVGDNRTGTGSSGNGSVSSGALSKTSKDNTSGAKSVSGEGRVEDWQTTTCDIVDVISRDLSPPWSDLLSDSETGGSDVSALADDIVDRVVGPRVSGWGQGAGLEKGQSPPPEKELKSGKSVRFALELREKEEEEREGKTEEEGARGGEVEVQEDGSRIVVCANGTRKAVSGDGKSVSLTFTNGDTKHVKPDGTVVGPSLSSVASAPLVLSVVRCTATVSPRPLTSLILMAWRRYISPSTPLLLHTALCTQYCIYTLCLSFCACIRLGIISPNTIIQSK